MKKLTINRLFLAILSCCALVACDGIGNAPENTQSSASGVANNEATTLATSITESDPTVAGKPTIVGKVVNLKPCISSLAEGCGFDGGHGTLDDPYIGTPVKLYHVDIVYTNNSKDLAVAVRTPAIPVTGNWSRTTWGCQAMTLLPDQSCTDTYSMIDDILSNRNSLPLNQQMVTWIDEHNQSHTEQVFESPLYVTLRSESDNSLAERKIIFVTKGEYGTNLGGFPGANSICNSEAAMLGEKSRNFKALLWGNYATQPGTEYYRKDRLTIIAKALDNDLNSGHQLKNSIVDPDDLWTPASLGLLDEDDKPLTPIYTGQWRDKVVMENLSPEDIYKTWRQNLSCLGWTKNSKWNDFRFNIGNATRNHPGWDSQPNFKFWSEYDPYDKRGAIYHPGYVIVYNLYCATGSNFVPQRYFERSSYKEPELTPHLACVQQ